MFCIGIGNRDVGVEFVAITEVFKFVADLSFDRFSGFIEILNIIHEQILFINFDNEFGIRQVGSGFNFEFEDDMFIIICFCVDNFYDIVIVGHINHTHIVHDPIGAVEGLTF